MCFNGFDVLAGEDDLMIVLVCSQRVYDPRSYPHALNDDMNFYLR